MGYLDENRATSQQAIQDQLSGSTGIASFPAAAAPANGVSLAEVSRGLYEHVRPITVTGTATITDASQTESTAFAIITVAPAAGAPLADVEVIIDLAKATTGYAAVESTATIQLRVSRKIDGTNWRGEAYQEAALSGTLAAGRAQRLYVGSVGVTQQVRIEAVMSADATSNIELPYIINYKGLAAPTVS